MLPEKQNSLTKYIFYNSLIFRYPALQWKNYHIDSISSVVLSDDFKGALLLASPELYGQLERKKFNWPDFNDKEKLSVFGYYNRMCFRPTPFGAFAGIGTAKWADFSNSNVIISELRVLPDWGIIVGKQNAIDTQLVWLNPTLYLIDREYRFIKTLRNKGESKFTFSLESIPQNGVLVVLHEVCAKDKITMASLIAHIQELTSCNITTANEFVDFLIDAQWLVNSDQPNITAKEQWHLANGFNKLLQLKSNFEKLISNAEQSRDKQQMYASLVTDNKRQTISQEYQKSLFGTIQALSFLTENIKNAALDNFIKEFRKRFDQQKIPLLVALDPFNGIGYQNLEEETGKLFVEDIQFTAKAEKTPSIEWTNFHKLILNKWGSGYNMVNGIVIGEADLEGLQPRSIEQQVIPVLFRETDNNLLLIESVGGITGTALIGRFTIWSEDINEIANDLAEIEQRANPEVIFAELLQVSDLHTDNINRRASLYDYEIPINATSLLPPEKQVLLNDLVISVRENKVILESLSHDKIVIPRLSSAYNYQRNNLAIFRFLADLQYQGVMPITLPDSQVLFPGLDFYPRISFENVVLCCAKWKISKHHLNPSNEETFIKLKNKFKIPDHVAIVRHDQQIVFNLQNSMELDYLLKYIQNSDSLWVQEYLVPTIDRPYVQQWLTYLYHENEIYNDRTQQVPERHLIPNLEFLPGSEWLYLKIYCNPAISAWLLVNCLRPVLKKLKNTYQIKWFFIRYGENGYHLRLRIQALEINIGPILTVIKNKLAKEVRFQLVRAYQADTYLPEWERYGPDLMHIVEDFFCAGSELILEWLNNAVSREEFSPDFSLGCRSTMDMIIGVYSEPDVQLAFLKQMSDSFYHEFGNDKFLKVSMDKKFRQVRVDLKSWLTDGDFYKRHNLSYEYLEVERKFSTLINADLSQSPFRKSKLLSDLIHMQINRLFSDQQRQHELLIYYCLYKYKLSEIAVTERGTKHPAGS